MSTRFQADTALDELLLLRDTWRTQGKRLVLTNGVFDLLHIGHVTYLQQARALGDLLVVGVNSDASTRANKGPTRPLVPQAERAALLAALRCVDHVTIFEQRTAEALVAALEPDVYVKGGDYRLDDGSNAGRVGAQQGAPLPEARIVRGYGGRVELIPYVVGRSTTELIEKIKLEVRG